MKGIVVLAMTCALGAPTMAAVQAAPDFSGAWTFDEAKSDPPIAGGRGRGAFAPPGLVIKQTAADITIESPGPPPATTVFKLDGSESVNVGPRGQTKSKSRWDGGKLITEGTVSVSTPQGDFDLTFKETRSLDVDGAMVSETSTDTPMGNFTRKIVYRKAP